MCDAARQFRFRHVRRRQDEHVPRGVAGEQGKGATARYSAVDRSASGDEARVAASAWGPVPNPNRPMANGQWRARDAILSLTRPRTGDPVTWREQRPAPSSIGTGWYHGTVLPQRHCCMRTHWYHTAAAGSIQCNFSRPINADLLPAAPSIRSR